MKNNKIEDERIITLRRKVQSEAYQILMYCLLISIVVQQFFLNAPFSQFAVEFISLIGMVILTTIRQLKVGIDIWGSKEKTNKKLIANILISAFISVILLAFLSGENNLKNLILFFACFSMISFLLNAVLRFINHKKQKDISDIMDAEEMDK
jgi:hypothetical protein